MLSSNYTHNLFGEALPAVLPTPAPEIAMDGELTPFESLNQDVYMGEVKVIAHARGSTNSQIEALNVQYTELIKAATKAFTGIPIVPKKFIGSSTDIEEITKSLLALDNGSICLMYRANRLGRLSPAQAELLKPMVNYLEHECAVTFHLIDTAVSHDGKYDKGYEVEVVTNAIAGCDIIDMCVKAYHLYTEFKGKSKNLKEARVSKLSKSEAKKLEVIELYKSGMKKSEIHRKTGYSLSVIGRYLKDEIQAKK